MTTTAPPPTAPKGCPEPTASLNCVLADLEAVKKAQELLTDLATVAPTLIDGAGKAPDLLLASQKAAQPTLKAAEGVFEHIKCELEKCKLSEEERKKLDECIPSHPPEKCTCESFDVPKLCLCDCTCGSASSGGTESEKLDTATLDRLERCFTAKTAETKELVEKSANLSKQAEELLKALAELEKKLEPGAAPGIEPERAYLEMKLSLQPQIEQLRVWVGATTPTAYKKRLVDAISLWLCLGHQRACALALTARDAKSDALNKLCEEATKGKSPIDQALECYHDSSCTPGSEPPAEGSSTGGTESATREADAAV